MIEQLRAPKAQQMREDEIENLIETEGRELLRRLLEAHLEERSPGKVCEPVVDRDKKEHTHQRAESREIKSLFGEVRLERQSYGGRGLKNLRPLDAELNLPEKRYSHPVRRRIAISVAKGSYDEAVATMLEINGLKIGKRQAEEVAMRAARDFDCFYETRRAATASEVKATSGIVEIQMDAKGVRMLREDLREPTRQAADKRTGRLDHRRSKGEKSCTKRMSTVASVNTIAPFVRTPEDIVRELKPKEEALPVRPRVEQKRVWASLEHSPETIVDQVMDEAKRRDPKGAKQWVAVVDGNQTQIQLLKAAAARQGRELTIILDLIHVLEYLWDAARAFHPEGDPNAEVWVSERLVDVLLGKSAQVAAGIRRRATRQGLSGKQREGVESCARYLNNHRELLRYDQYLAAGYPIASGIIEGACRYLVKDRMDITGARWRLKGAEAILRLRSLLASGDFDEYWEYHLEQEYQRNHAAQYLDGQAPKPISSQGPKRKGAHLKLVK
ncbi:MAG: ISKra4 family transposase [Blastocatellales bacterium]|nr:ISKra4 family transposase [Blastocatellales bacterium]